MAATSDSEVFLSISINRDGKVVMSQQGERIIRDPMRKPPDPKNVDLVTTIQIYRKKTEPGKKTKPPCVEFVNPPGIWFCACDPPSDCE